VVVAVGVNDVALKVPESVTKANLEFLASSLNEAGVSAVFLTIPPSNKFTPDQIAQVKKLNSWILAALPAENVKVVDLYSWFEDPQNPGKVNPTLAADYIHPTKDGYKQLAALAWNALEPLVARSFRSDPSAK
jgi:lysophospholipase L1-like esterase